MTFEENLNDVVRARLGLFIHYGLYSLLGRGEWAMNKEQIPVDQYMKLADEFDCRDFDPPAIAAAAREMGAHYLCLTTMHHEGFPLYESQIKTRNTVTTAAKRDLVQEMVDACRNEGLRVHLYHSLNDWSGEPDSVDALESEDAYEQFIETVFARLRELVERFNPIECLWYDGWWPFDAKRWQAERMNAMVREVQPHLLVNGRNGLEGDFTTPEGHVSAPRPWRPWEACMTHNSNWGYHAGDPHFQSTSEVVQLLTKCAAGNGNLLINVGPTGSGELPEPTQRMMRELGQWIEMHRDALMETEVFDFDAVAQVEPGDLTEAGRADWLHHGQYTVRGNTLYAHLFCWPGQTLTIGGLRTKARSATLMTTGASLNVEQNDRQLIITGLPEKRPQDIGGIVAIECDAPPALHPCGGHRIPQTKHPRYDPSAPDIAW